MDMNLFDIILLAASHPVTWQQSSEILLWGQDFVEGVEMPRLTLKYTIHDDFFSNCLTPSTEFMLLHSACSHGLV